MGDRPEYWRVAVEDAAQHPALGSGAGSFDNFWFQHRTIPANVHDAHNLYLEVLAELGLVGFLLLCLVLVPPLVAARRARNQELVAVAAAGYISFLVHTALDWDWEMPVTTLAGLALGASLLVAASPGGNSTRFVKPPRIEKWELEAGG
jgi:O-antigen ligase